VALTFHSYDLEKAEVQRDRDGRLSIADCPSNNDVGISFRFPLTKSCDVVQEDFLHRYELMTS
jgi:hypothetical protein